MNWRETAVVPGVVFVGAALAVTFGFSRFLVQAALSMQVHEFGHALVAWLGGIFAVPIPMVTVKFSDDRSILVVLAVAGALAVFLLSAWAEDCRAAAALTGLLLVLQALLTLFASKPTLEFWISFGGLGAECWVAAFLIAAYFEPLPEIVQWPRYRLFFLVVGACVLAQSVRLWREASVDFEKVPWGSFWGGDGDVEAMLAGGWTVNRLVQVYVRSASLSVLLAGAAWGRAVWICRRGSDSTRPVP